MVYFIIIVMQQRITRHHYRPKQPSNKQRRLFLIVLGVLVGLILIAITIAFMVTRGSSPATPTASSDEQYHFSSSKYKGITSKFTTRDTHKEHTSIEQPITHIAVIDEVIGREVTAIDTDFKESVAQGSRFHDRMTQTITYQVTHNTDTHLSLVLYTKQDTMGAHPVDRTTFWTFDKQSGKEVTLKDLTGDNAEHLETIATSARKAIGETLRQRQQSIEQATLREIDATRLTHFIITEDTKLGFPFSASGVLASSYGAVNVRIPATSIATALATPLAKSLFQLPTEPPKPPAPPAAPTPTPAPQGGGCGGSPCAALTFDDGPGPHTSYLLDVLRDKNAKASFFVLGSKVARQASLLQRMKQEGHHIGNHTWNHPNLTKLAAGDVASEVSRTNDAIRQAIGSAPTTIRPPYGATNAAVNSQFAQLGVASIMWSVDTRDWADRDSAIVCQRAVGSAQSGSIILLHDIHKTSVDAVPCIIDGLQKQGFQLVSIDTLLGTLTPGATYHAR